MNNISKEPTPNQKRTTSRAISRLTRYARRTPQVIPRVSVPSPAAEKPAPKKRITTVKKTTATVAKVKPLRVYKRKLALLLPGHNEELIIAITIRSAIKAGQKKRDIF